MGMAVSRHGRASRPKGPKIPLADADQGRHPRRARRHLADRAGQRRFLVLVGKAMDDVLNGDARRRHARWPLLVVIVAAPRPARLVGARCAARRRPACSRSTCATASSAASWPRARPVRSQEQTGRIVATGTQSVELSSTFYATFLGPIIGSMTTPIVVLLVIGVFIDVRTALTLAVVVPIIPLTVGLFQRAFQKVSDDYTEAVRDALRAVPRRDPGPGDAQAVQPGPRLRHDACAAAAEQVRQSIMRLLLGNQIVLFVVDTVFSLGMVTAVDRARDDPPARRRDHARARPSRSCCSACC